MPIASEMNFECVKTTLFLNILHIYDFLSSIIIIIILIMIMIIIINKPNLFINFQYVQQVFSMNKYLKSQKVFQFN